MEINCFKSYDIRGVVGESVSEDVFYRIGRALVRVMAARNVVVGHDARASSPVLATAFANGVRDEGADILDIGLSGTEEIYFATSHFHAGAGAVITASHNPIEYNGMKFVGEGSAPLRVESEFLEIKALAENLEQFSPNSARGKIFDVSLESRSAYASKVLSFVDAENLKPLRLVINCGNGAAGPALREIKRQLKEKKSELAILEVFEEPDPSFPNGIPNPILPENHHFTSNVVLTENADFGVAFDGDFDRCFFFDRNGEFVPGEIMVGLLAAFFAAQGINEVIVHDPRLVFNTQKVCERYEASPIQSRTGHLFMKQVMRDHKAVYGGEISAHHYFRDFFYCDSGMIPWLVVADLLSKSNLDLTQFVTEQKSQFPSSGEKNFSIDDTAGLLRAIEGKYKGEALEIDKEDGLSVFFENWRFNLRGSNTEPLVRLNIETQGDLVLLEQKLTELTHHLENF
ncbi:MAG: phosphomannomutase [Proteobacteria bacterium]|nr:phosphomannomutase [Pseudomonadota bacterium]